MNIFKANYVTCYNCIYGLKVNYINKLKTNVDGGGVDMGSKSFKTILNAYQDIRNIRY